MKSLSERLDNPILSDLENNLHEKIKLNTIDFIDRCKTAGIDPTLACATMQTTLVFSAALALKCFLTFTPTEGGKLFTVTMERIDVER